MLHCLLSDVFSIKTYHIVLDRTVDTPGHEKDLVNGFNYVQKRYLDTCLRMRSTTEVDKIDSTCMRIDVMTKKVEVSFAKECKSLLDLRDEIGTKGDKKHAKLESEARLKHKYYWVHHEEDTLFNVILAVYKILNNQDKLTMTHIYYIKVQS